MKRGNPDRNEYRWAIATMKWVLLTLAVIAFIGGVLNASQERTHPIFDETDYIAQAHLLKQQGGLGQIIACFFNGTCTESNRQPFYLLSLAPVLNDGPSAYAHAKLHTLACSILLLLVVFTGAWRLFDKETAIFSVIGLTLMPAFEVLSYQVLSDVLFAALVFVVVYGIGRWQSCGWQRWLIWGCMLGLAYQTKGSGHLFFIPLILTGIYHHRQAFVTRPVLWASLISFTAISSYLLYRNYSVYGSLFFNYNNHALWMDQWEDVWIVSRSSQWEQMNFFWYLEHHTLWELCVRFFSGLVQSVGQMTYTSGMGGSNPLSQAISGAVVVTLGALGLRHRFQQHQTEVFAITSSLAVYIAALSLAAKGLGGVHMRFVFPLAILLVPHAVHFVLLRYSSLPIRKRLRFLTPALQIVLMVFIIAKLFVHVDGFTANPLHHYHVRNDWRETSTWLNQHLQKNEKVAVSPGSEYSIWDSPQPNINLRWNYPLDTDSASLKTTLAQFRIRKVLVDTADPAFSGYADKLSRRADPHGPLRFLDWPRCFADSHAPSRFMVFCKPDGTAAPAAAPHF